MITTKDNLFDVLAAEVSTSGRSELYLIADLEFEMANPSAEARRVLEVAKAVANAGTAVEALGRHFNTCGAQMRSALLADGSSALFQVNHVAVEATLRKIEEAPKTYRVLFTRVDAVKLAVDTKACLDALEARAKKAEDAHTSAVQDLAGRLTKLGG